LARVEVSPTARADLERLTRTHSLRADTKDRVERSLRPLVHFPLLGPELGGSWSGFRFVLGPWRWLIVIYAVLDDDRVVVVTFQDGRAAPSD
jgi:plasmid stabilization system protein ParE